MYSGTENCKENETVTVTASALGGTSLDSDYHAGFDQPRSQSSSAISHVTPLVKLVEKIRYRTRFQASSGNSDSKNWPGYKAGLDGDRDQTKSILFPAFRLLHESGAKMEGEGGKAYVKPSRCFSCSIFYPLSSQFERLEHSRQRATPAPISTGLMEPRANYPLP